MSSLRDEMPSVAAWIDDLRAAFGRETIDQAIRGGMAGHPTFHAVEGGHEIGTPVMGDEDNWIEVDAIDRAGEHK